jgi:bacillolysin
MTRRRTSLGTCAVIAFALVAAVAPTAGAQERPVEEPGARATRATVIPDEAAEEAEELLREELGRARIASHDETGRVRFVGLPRGRPAAVPGTGASPVAAARAFVDRYGPAFGAGGPGQDSLQVVGTRRPDTPEGGGAAATVRLQQTHEGIPVLAGELNVQLDAENRVLSAAGELLPHPELDTTPTLAAHEAEETARRSVARNGGVDVAALSAAASELWIHNPVLLGGPGLDLNRLVWRTEITADEPPVRELVLVDAHSGAVVLSIDQLHGAKNRQVCDNANTVLPKTCLLPVRIEGGPAHAVADVNAAYDYSGETYDFFATRFGRDSIDGDGMVLKSTVRHCEAGSPCPYDNAFWDGQQMTYGAGFATDDVVAHELTHGVTEHEANLLYYYQSGAINESMSDVFGELIDQANTTGLDTPAHRWLVGEDLPIGAIRDMANPGAFGDPDRMTSALYHSGSDDSGGVHSNSGVGNRAAVLLIDGGTFNGHTVSPLGATKTAAIFYEALTTMLTSGSGYADLHAGLQQACTNLVGSDGITTPDCLEVRDAVDATEMHLDPVTGAATARAPVCPAGQVATGLYAEGFEGGSDGWESDPDGWFVEQFFASEGVSNVAAMGRPVAADDILTSPVLATPAAGITTHLRFAHAHDFEQGAWDGGVVEVSTDDGTTWSDLAPLITDHGYNGTIQAGAGNPLAGRAGFVDRSFGYTATRADLTSLAGTPVRIRFRNGSDDAILSPLGWVVDDVRVYTCAPSAPNLRVTSLGDPPAARLQGTAFTVGSTTTNAGTATATSSTTRFLLSADKVRNDSDRLLTGARSVPSLAAGAASTGNQKVTVPANMSPGRYFLLACADDLAAVTESDETDNCRASTGRIKITASLPDLRITAATEPPGTRVRGKTFPVTATTANVGTAAAPASVTRYWLSTDKTRNAGDRRMAGGSNVAGLAAGQSAVGKRAVTIPSRTPPGRYFVLACADDTALVNEANEANNCRTSTKRLRVTT